MFLLANWLETLLPLIFVFIWIARAFLEAKGNESKEPVPEDLIELEGDDDPAFADRQMEARAEGRAAEHGRPVLREQQGKAVDDDPFRSEVEEFLRQLSGEEREGKQGRGQQGLPGDPQQPSPAERAQAKKRQAQQAAAEKAEDQRRLARERRERERRQAARAEYDRSFEQQETVGEHVRQHLGRLEESQLAEKAAHLGEDLSLTDERVAERLHRKFDHKLGKLDRRDEQQDQQAAKPVLPSTAESLAAMLANPEGIRNAIILNEILNRPPDRW